MTGIPDRSLGRYVVTNIIVGLALSIGARLLSAWLGWLPTLHVPAGAWPRSIALLTLSFACAGLCAWLGDRRPKLWRHYYASSAAGVLFFFGILGTTIDVVAPVWTSLLATALIAATLSLPLAFIAHEVAPALAPADAARRGLTPVATDGAAGVDGGPLRGPPFC